MLGGLSWHILNLTLDKNTALVKLEITRATAGLRKDMALLKQDFENQSTSVKTEVTRGLQKREDEIIRTLVSSMFSDSGYILRISNVGSNSPDSVAMEKAFDLMTSGKLQISLFASKIHFDSARNFHFSPLILPVRRGGVKK